MPECMRTLVGHFFIIDQNQCTIYIMACRAALMQCIHMEHCIYLRHFALWHIV